MAANFSLAYDIIKREEGGYANVPGDRGGETYAGISRKNWPHWKGWPIIDKEKILKGGKLPWNYKLQDYNLEMLVKEFYLQYWNQAKAGLLNSQTLANIYFDHAVNGGPGGAVLLLQKALNSIGHALKVDGGFGEKTLAAVNGSNSAQLHDAFKVQRELHYRKLADNGDDEFIKGWLSRLSRFPDQFTDQVKKKAA